MVQEIKREIENFYSIVIFTIFKCLRSLYHSRFFKKSEFMF